VYLSFFTVSFVGVVGVLVAFFLILTPFLDPLAENVRGALALAALSVAVLFLVVAMVTSYFMTHQLTVPILDLQRKTLEVREGRQFSIQRTRQDEIGDLEESFGELVQHLQQASKELEEKVVELGTATQKAVEANESKTRFLANVSHELRTPLNAVLGFTQLMLRGEMGELSPKARSALQDVEHSAQHLKTLITDLLELSRSEVGRLELDKLPSDPAEVARQAVSTVSGVMAERQQQFELDIPTTLPAIMLDHVRIKQVIVNLLSNASKYNSRGGKITLKVDRDMTNTRFSVTDTGVGIPDDKLENVFEAFSRVAGVKVDDRSVEGTGLGLALVRTIVTLHGGEVEVQSTLGEGSTFMVSLPNPKVDLRLPTLELSSTTEEAKADLMLHNLPQSGILLLVEDNPINGRLIERLLSSYDNWELRWAEDPEQADEWIGEADLVLCDLNLQGRRGEDLVEKWRGAQIEIPIFALTADLSVKLEDLVEKGFNGMLEKPIDLDLFHHLLAGKWEQQQLAGGVVAEKSSAAVASHSIPLRALFHDLGNFQSEIQGLLSMVEEESPQQGHLLSLIHVSNRLMGLWVRATRLLNKLQTEQPQQITIKEMLEGVSRNLRRLCGVDWSYDLQAEEKRLTSDWLGEAVLVIVGSRAIETGELEFTLLNGFIQVGLTSNQVALFPKMGDDWETNFRLDFPLATIMAVMEAGDHKFELTESGSLKLHYE